MSGLVWGHCVPQTRLSSPEIIGSHKASQYVQRDESSAWTPRDHRTQHGMKPLQLLVTSHCLLLCDIILLQVYVIGFIVIMTYLWALIATFMFDKHVAPRGGMAGDSGQEAILDEKAWQAPYSFSYGKGYKIIVFLLCSCQFSDDGAPGISQVFLRGRTRHLCYKNFYDQQTNDLFQRCGKQRFAYLRKCLSSLKETFQLKILKANV